MRCPLCRDFPMKFMIFRLLLQGLQPILMGSRYIELHYPAPDDLIAPFIYKCHGRQKHASVDAESPFKMAILYP